MDENNIQQQLNDINKKMNTILEEIELQRRHRREMENLKDDLMRVGTDLYHSAVEELEEMHDHINTGDILFLGKKLLRNVNTITKSVEQLESLKDFMTDAAPLTRESVINFMHKLDEYDRKGYFEFAKELSKAVDNVVTSFTPEDAKNLADNLVTILNTVKNLTQPDMLQALNNALTIYKKLDIEVEEKVSLFSLIKEINSPEMKKGLSFGVKFLKSMANPEIKKDLIEINKSQNN